MKKLLEVNLNFLAFKGIFIISLCFFFLDKMSLIGHDNYVKTIMKKRSSLDSSFNASKIEKYLLAPINMIMTNGSYRRTKIPPNTKMKLF